MADFNELIAASFSDIEMTLFKELARLFREAMAEVLEKLDAELAKKRDKRRYVVQEIKETGLETKLGPVRFRRRVYLDRQTGERVYGLDEALGLEKRARVSPGLKQSAVKEAAEGVSYRGARDSLAHKFGHQVISHETVRQLVLKAGQLIEEADKRLVLETEEERAVGVLFIEADGLYVSRQKVGKREERFTVAHEGWRRRSPGSNEYELVNKTHVHCGAKGDIWEETSGALSLKYDLSKTMVVINGDRAGWIRRGVEYFPNAIYQFDRFHLLREIKAKLRLAPAKVRSDVLMAIYENRAYEALALMRKVKLPDAKAQRELDALRRDLEAYPEAMRDYRVRLAEMGYDTTGMRGMGSAESIMNDFARRLRKQGRSWSGAGLAAMIRVLIKCFEGKLEDYTRWLNEIGDRFDLERVESAVSRVVQETVRRAVALDKTYRMPIRGAGRNASGGLSVFMNRLNQAMPREFA